MTRRRALAFLATAATLVVAALPSPAQAVRPTLTPGGTSAFGQTSLLLTLPHGAKVPADATLTEDGRQVRDVSVTPATAVPGSYGLALVLDASSRRAGRAIQAQLAAARALVAARPDGLPMALLTYNGTATVAVPFTTERGPLLDALRQAPPLARGTHVRDAVGAALDLFDREKLGGGAVVALAGEPDSGSATSAGAVTRRAVRRGVWIFGAGLEPGGAARRTLDALTPDGVGQNLGDMNGPGLVALLEALARQTGAASVLSYSSAARPGSEVAVLFQAGDRQVRALATVARPAAATEVAAVPSAAGDGVPFLRSPVGRLLVAALVVALLFGGIAPLLLLGRRRKDLHGRLADYASDATVKTATVADGEGGSRHRESQLLGGARMRRLAATLELARIDVSAGQLVLRTLAAAVLAGYLTAVAGGIPLAGVGAGVTVILVVRQVVLAKLARQRKLFADQLADALQASASAMRGGHSFVGALSTIVDEAPEPASTEFRRVVAAERIGIPLDQAFEEMIARMGNRDVRQVALVALLQRETGGNAAEAVDRVVDNLRGRDDVRRLVNTLTSQGRMSRWVLTGMPVTLALALTVINGDYMAPLYESTPGRVLLAVGVAMCTAGSMVIGRIIEIEV